MTLGDEPKNLRKIKIMTRYSVFLSGFCFRKWRSVTFPKWNFWKFFGFCFRKWRSVNSQVLDFVSVICQYGLRVLPPIFDLSLSYQISWRDDASFNPIFLLKHLTQKVYDDSLSAVTVSPSGSRELIKFETSKAINFGYSYPIFMKFLPFDFKF